MQRAFDILASAVGLVALSPLLAVVALAVLADLGRPVIFTQERVGRAGVPFRMRKFRSMRPGPGTAVTATGDPRVSRLGAFLRRTKLDELPQLWDVLRGKMALVGPRPEVPSMIRHYPEPARSRILSVRPGITDLASIEFRNEEELLARHDDPERAYVEEILPRKIELHLEYVEKRSLWFDIVLLLKTQWMIVTRR